MNLSCRRWCAKNDDKFEDGNFEIDEIYEDDECKDLHLNYY